MRYDYKKQTPYTHPISVNINYLIILCIQVFSVLQKSLFHFTPDPEFLYLSPNHKKALTILKYGLMSQAGFTVITGAIGAGKTTLVRHILNNNG